MLKLKKMRNYVIRAGLDLAAAIYKPPHVKDIQALITSQIKKIPYYSGYGDDFSKYPYLDASKIKEVMKSIRRKPFAIFACTSGTTGLPVTFIRDIRSVVAEQYFMEQYAQWKGMYRIIMRGEKFISPENDPECIFLDVPMAKEMYVSSYHLNENRMDGVIKCIQGKRNACLWAYPSTAAFLAEYCIRNRVRLPISSVVLSSETMTDLQADTIEQGFGCRIKDWYGLAERVAALYRCEAGCYHIPLNYSNIEFLPNGDGLFEIVGTSLHNHAMPLVRYRTGDLVELLEGRCSCGSSDDVVVKRILGRSSAVIMLDGRAIPECTAGCTVKESKHVRNFQIHVRENGMVRYDIVREPSFSRSDEVLLHELISNVFPRNVYEIRYVDDIPRTENGKQKMVVHES